MLLVQSGKEGDVGEISCPSPWQRGAMQELTLPNNSEGRNRYTTSMTTGNITARISWHCHLKERVLSKGERNIPQISPLRH